MALSVVIPNNRISGFMAPIITFPVFLAIRLNVVPFTYAICGLKTVMLKDSTDTGYEFIALTIFMFVIFFGVVFTSKETNA